jgi:hypothetical protein
MNQITTSDLEKLGRDAACEVAGPSAFEHVAVEAGGDFDNRPVYIFSFVIDQDRARDRPGAVRIALGQKLRDALDALGDEHYPTIRILSREDWDKRARA